ncbi:MAG: histidine phosphatase family protein [Anaerolineae bacterium]|nr:histidine phosphatase family protein [Anaerolineae bacterium]
MPVVWFIRHGESESNANLKTTHPAESALTAQGYEEAIKVPPVITQQPDLIVVSPYLRARQTAVPTIEKFPNTAVETWPVEEFTYLHPGEYEDTTGAERWPAAKAYWEGNDPQLKHGGAGESFVELMVRVQALQTRLAQHPADFIVMFSHGLFLRAVLHSNIVGSYEATALQMERYRHFVWAVHMPNCAILKATIAANGRFTFSGYDTIHLTD